MKVTVIWLVSFLTVAPQLISAGAMAQGIQGMNDSPPPLSSIKRTYPGGRDDSDLTVQPQKRITKKETEDRTTEPDEGDYDQGDATSGFGE